MKLRILLPALFLAAICQAKSAEVTVQWGTLIGGDLEAPNATDIVTGNVFLATNATTYASGLHTNPAVGASYYPNAGTSFTPAFNSAGAATIGGNANTSLINPQIQQNANFDRIRFSVTGATTLEAMVVWEDLPAANNTLTSLAHGGFRSNAGTTEFRFLLRKGGQFYASAPFPWTGGGTPTGDFSIADASAASWFAFTPMTNGVGTVASTASPIGLTEITAVGYYAKSTSATAVDMSYNSGYFKASLTNSGNTAPTTTITAPANNSTVMTGTNVSFTATASDAEDGDISASVVWSSNRDGNLGTGASISTSALSNGAHTITASVTDNGSLTGASTITLTVSPPPNPAPTVTVTAPANGTMVTAGTTITFTGTAIDPDDGNLSSGIAWKSDLNGHLGSGASIDVSTLSLGTHTITASATDSALQTSSASISVTIKSNGTTGGVKPNVIVIVCDDAGYADFGFMNGLSGATSQVPTPFLDALAARGVTFSRAYVAANCQPTRAAIVTGAYQQRVGNENVGNNNYLASEIFEGIPLSANTIWDRFRGLGYSTGAIGKWHLGEIGNTPQQLGNRPQYQGLDEFYGIWHGSRDFMVGGYTNPNYADQVSALREAVVHANGSITDTIVEAAHAGEYITHTFGNYAVDFIGNHYNDGKPFLLYQAFTAPHKPWTNQSPDFNDPRIAGLTGYRKQVASMMITMDKEIGRMMARLDDPNNDGNTSDSIKDNTLVVFINDNGGVAGLDPVSGLNGTDNGVLNNYKGSPREGGIRVPMILAGAGLDPSKQGTVYDKPVHGIDILPTAFGLAGGTFVPGLDRIDGVNLLPFLNGTDPASPHEVLVHRWRGTFAVIKGDWKLINTRNVNAAPGFYQLYNVATDIGELTDRISEPAQAALVEELKRHLTDHEAIFDKSRYPILDRTLETEPLNIIDHFTFRPGMQADWSGASAWYEGGTPTIETLFDSDGFAGGILEFPASTTGYTANNNLRRQTGMEFMLNRMILSGTFNGSGNRSATIPGNDLIFTRDLRGNGPRIVTEATNTGGGNFGYNINLNLILYDDLTLTGDGNAPVTINGRLSQYFAPRGLIKNGTSTVTLTANNNYAGDTTVKAGLLSMGQPNTNNQVSSVRIGANGATLHLAFAGTDTVQKLFIGGVQKPAGVYEAVGNPGDGTEVPQLTGPGTLTVTVGPVVFSTWSAANAPGETIDQDHDYDGVQNGIEYFMGATGTSFTALPSPDLDGKVTWPMATSYAGIYGTNYLVQDSPDLIDWNPVTPAQVTVTPGTSVSYTLPPDSDRIFVRLCVNLD